LKRIILLLLLLLFIAVPVASCSVKSVEITPANPTQGDLLTLEIQADPLEEVSVSLDYSGEAPVSDGKYDIRLKDLDIPQIPNRFLATVSDVKNIRVTVDWPISITLNKDATDGVVSIGQSNIPPHEYDIRVWGYALPGVSEVSLSFSASITLTMDDSGYYSYSYDTDSISPGILKVNVGGVKKTITLSDDSWAASGGGGAISPVAAFTVTGNYTSEETLIFDAGSSLPGSGDITEYRWSFGDGQTAEEARTTHIYNVPGVYTVKLVVVNSYGLENSKTMTLEIEEKPNLAPVVLGGGVRSCLPGQVLDFRSQSFDPDGVVVKYLWSFGDGVEAEGSRVSHSWAVPGTYMVNHTVVDDKGASSAVFYTIHVENIHVPVLHSREELVEGAFSEFFEDLGLRVTVSGNHSMLYILQYSENPTNASMPEGQLGNIIDIVVSDPLGVDWPIYVEVNYNRQTIDNVSEARLGLYYYNGEVWKRCTCTGVYPSRGVVWGNITRDELTGSPLTIGIVPPLPYFKVHNLCLKSSVVEEGKPIEAGFNVTNSGQKSGNIVILLYLDDTPIISRTIHLEVGEEKKVLIRFPAPSRGEHTIRVENLVKPVTVVPQTVPDLVCSLTANQTLVGAGKNILLHYSIRNAGNKTAENFTCNLSLDGLKVCEHRIDVLAPGENRTWSYTWIMSRGGLHEAVFTVSDKNELCEVNKDNNLAQIIVEVNPAKANNLFMVLGVALVLLIVYYLWLRKSTLHQIFASFKSGLKIELD